MLLEIGKKEIHFLMGAGASFASVDTSPFRVPLGAQLFDSLEKNLNSFLLGDLDDSIKNEFRKDFEKGMQLFFDQGINPTWLQCELATYFLKFCIGDANIYLKLIDVLENNKSIYSFSTTNYELLIEQSLDKKGKRPYYGIDVRSENSNLVSILKIHGSANFIADADLSTTLIAGGTFPPRASIATYPAKAAMPDEAFHFASGNNGFAPSLAMYAKGKNVLHAPGVVELQLDLWRLKLKHQCKMLVIVGLRVIEHDNHIWDFLASEIDIPILYIGDQNEFQEWVKKHDRSSCIFLGDRFEECLGELEQYISGQRHVEVP